MKASRLKVVEKRKAPAPIDQLRDELAFVRKHLEDLERRLMAALGPATAA